MRIHRKTRVYRYIEGCTYEYRGLPEYKWVYIAIHGISYNPGDYMVGDYNYVTAMKYFPAKSICPHVLFSLLTCI